MRTRFHWAVLSTLILANGIASAAPTTAPSDPRLQWWREARFGMFVHWGLYAITAGHYKGGTGTEHIMQNLKIPLAEYALLANQFNPTQWDANAFVSIARNAGMKYIVITAKHHDGFAMFNSPSTDYNVAKRTPFAHDPMADLAAACKDQGIKLCFYYSLGRDWQDPDVPTKNGYRSNTWDYPDEAHKVFAKYFERKVKPQIRELLTQYGPVGIIWFDTPEEISPAESQELLDLIHSIQPNCIVDSRIGNGLGDYMVEEQRIPAAGDPTPWETCMTMNGSWGYRSDDNRWKSPEQLVFNLCDIVSKGGNFLLNVGPTAQGIIPEPAVKDLGSIGEWMKSNSEAIYGTTASHVGSSGTGRTGVPDNAWRCTTKDGKLYFILFNWTKPTLDLPALPADIATAYLLADPAHTPLTIKDDQGKKSVELPATLPDTIANVICIQEASEHAGN